MQGLSASQTIGLWERGSGQHPVDRALTLLAAACPDLTPVQLAEFGIGRRDRCLLELREAIFGSTLDVNSACPRCAETVEFCLHTPDLKMNSAPGGDARKLEEAGIAICYRLLNHSDMAAAARSAGLDDARHVLLNRCVLEASREGVPVGSEELPEPLVSRLAARLAEADPQADLALDLHCADCDYTWEVQFDISSFLWTEIEVIAKRLLAEAHTLARTYGWSEADILAMTSARRRFYLEMVS